MDDLEKLDKEDLLQKPAKAIGVFIFSLALALTIFCFFAGAGDGSGKGSGSGAGSGAGHGEGVGSGIGNDSGDGIGESATDGLGTGDNGNVDDEVIETDAVIGESDSSASENVIPPEDEVLEEKLELPAPGVWSPSSFKIGPKKNKQDKSDALASSAGRGGGGGRGKPMGTGDISFRIYWKPAEDDIDLHVLDPSGHHLWYSHKGCACQGQLDVDDTSNGGPENIFWPENKAPKGQYRFYVKYYAGEGTKNVIIEVRKGTTIVKKYKTVLKREGESSKEYLISH